LTCGAEGWSRGVVEGRGQRRVKDNVRQRDKWGWDETAFRLGIELHRGMRGAPGVLPTLAALNRTPKGDEVVVEEGESINNDIVVTVDMERTKRGNACKDCKGGHRVLSVRIDYRSYRHRTREGERPRSGFLDKNDIHWRRGHVLGTYPVSPGYKLGVPTTGHVRR